MNIVQQLLNSNVRTEGASSRFQFASRSARFSTGTSGTESNFSEELRRKLSSSSSKNTIRLDTPEDRSMAVRSDGSDATFLEKFGGDEGGSKAKEEAFAKGLRERIRTSRQAQNTTSREAVLGSSSDESYETNQSRGDESAKARSFDTSRGEESGLSEKDRRLLKKLRNGEVDLSDNDEVKRLRELLQSAADEDSSPEKTREVMKALQGLFSNPSKILEQLQGQNAEELKSDLEGLTKLLKSFRKVAGESKKKTTETIARKVESVLEELNLEESDEENSSGSNGLLSKVKNLFESTGTESSKESSKSSDGKNRSTPTQKLQRTLGNVIDKLEKLSQRLSGQGESSRPVNPGKAVEKIKSFLENIKQSLNGSGNSTKDRSGTGFLGKQTQQVLDELDRKVQDEDLRRKIKEKLRKLTGKTDDKPRSNEARSSSSSESSRGEKAKQVDSEQTKTKTTSDSNESSKSKGKAAASNAKSNSGSTSSGSTSADEAKRSENSGQSSESKESSSSSRSQSSGEKPSQSLSGDSENSNSSGSSTKDSESFTSKKSDSAKSNTKQSNANGSESKTSGKSGNTKGPTPTAEAVKEKANESGKKKSSSSTTSGKSSGSETSGKNTSKEGQKVKTAAVKNQPDKADSSAKTSGKASNQSSETSQVKASKQSFEASEKQVQQASRSKDVVVDKGDVKREDSRSKTASTRTDKLASFETNSARALDASEQSGTSFSNGGNSNGNSGNLSANVKSQVASYTQRSPEARKMINQIVERAQTMLKDGKQSMRMQLQPESLGEVKLEVSIEANKVSARFKVENSSVKKTLNGSMEQLKQSLQQMGLDVDGVEVSDMSAEEGGNEEQWFDEPDDNGRGRGAGGDGEETEEGAVDEATERRRRLREYSTIELVA